MIRNGVKTFGFSTNVENLLTIFLQCIAAHMAFILSQNYLCLSQQGLSRGLTRCSVILTLVWSDHLGKIELKTRIGLKRKGILRTLPTWFRWSLLTGWSETAVRRTHEDRASEVSNVFVGWPRKDFNPQPTTRSSWTTICGFNFDSKEFQPLCDKSPYPLHEWAAPYVIAKYLGYTHIGVFVCAPVCVCNIYV